MAEKKWQIRIAAELDLDLCQIAMSGICPFASSRLIAAVLTKTSLTIMIAVLAKRKRTQ
jgi:hypothetical protein